MAGTFSLSEPTIDPPSEPPRAIRPLDNLHTSLRGIGLGLPTNAPGTSRGATDDITPKARGGPDWKRVGWGEGLDLANPL